MSVTALLQTSMGVWKWYMTSQGLQMYLLRKRGAHKLCAMAPQTQGSCI